MAEADKESLATSFQCFTLFAYATSLSLTTGPSNKISALKFSR